MDITELTDDVEKGELSPELSEVLHGVDRKHVRDLIMTACELEHEVGEPLTDAWLQLDACRSVLRDTDHPAILGRLDLVASLLREAVFSLLSTSAKCRTAAIDAPAVASARGENCRSDSDNRGLYGLRFPVRGLAQKRRQVRRPGSSPRAHANAR